MAIPQGGPDAATRVNRSGSDPGPQLDAGLRGRGVRGRAASDMDSVPDVRGEYAARLAPAERHARLLDRFVTQYADDTGKKATDKSVRKVAAATVSLFQSDGIAQGLFNPRDDRSWWQKTFGRGGAPRQQDDLLFPRKHEGVSTVRDFSKALGGRAEARLEHFHRVIQADPNLLKTKMGMFSISTREQRQKMRAIAAGLLLCGFDRNSVAYAMKAMRAAINDVDPFDLRLNAAYEKIKGFIQSGGANRDFADMLGAKDDLEVVRDILTTVGREHLPKEPVPDLLRGVIEDSQAWPEEVGNAAPAAGTISRDQIDDLKQEAADVASDQVGRNERYVEQQSGDLCGKHAANAYLHGDVIGERSLAAFLKINEFWNNPDQVTIDNSAAINPSKGNHAGNIANYLNWLNAQHRLGERQKPLITEHYRSDSPGDVEELKHHRPKDSHMMYYTGRGAYDHIVAFHPQRDGSFRLFDSLGGNLFDRLPKKDPLRFAESRLSDGAIGFVRPAEDVAEAMRAFAVAMTVDKIQQLNSNTRTLLENFLRKVTDPGREFDSEDKRKEFLDQLHQKLPDLWSVLQESSLASPQKIIGAREQRYDLNEDQVPLLRREMKKLVDAAAEQITKMSRIDQIRLHMVLGRYDAAQARQNYAEHVVQQRYPSLSPRQIEPIGTAIEKEVKRQTPLWPEDDALEPDDCAALDRIALSMANDLFGPPPATSPQQAPQAPPPPAAAGAPPAHDYTVPDYESDEEK